MSLEFTDASPVSIAPLGRRTTRATSVGLLPPPTAAEIVTDYQAMYAQSLWEGSPEDSREYISFLVRIVRTIENHTLHQAMAGSDYDTFWKPAVEAEMKLLSPECLDCYDVVFRAEVSHGSQILQSKMYLKYKRNTTGDLDKRKGRLVALGNLEAPDPDRDLFSPTINNKTINLMFALAAQHGLQMHGLDIYGAFITAFIESPVYFQLPKGLRPDIHGEPPIWKLKKTLY